MNNTISIIAQAFYGNRTKTYVNKENVDRFILGYQDDSITVTEPIDRTIIHIPNTDGIVIVYNKYSEEENKERMKSVAVIPEENIELHSRCIACRMNADGELESLQEGDFDIIIKYFAE